jgi:hypothetical protein
MYKPSLFPPPITIPYTKTGPPSSQDEDTSLSLWQLLATRAGKVSVSMDVLCLLGMAPFVVIEWATLRAYGLHGWASAWNILDVATYVLQVCVGSGGGVKGCAGRSDPMPEITWSGKGRVWRGGEGRGYESVRGGGGSICAVSTHFLRLAC